ncbi:hypothetical protein CAG60_03275 [Vibrio sp. V33_P6A3T137]|uniref:hypothetical protein n=1 Tax=Vibrio sp. V33_P6A3T137 TaxID=1938685 RepID=UPI001372A08B|nr:hypothetical protein [Vibrio sp. V33_P6A3T137]NAW77904.1 hypothetical protein [Vibrio sp. V33_P6A3T137]
MNPRDDSVNVDDVKLNQVLKLMYEIYNKQHKTSAQIGSYKFTPEMLIAKYAADLEILINEQRTQSRLSNCNDKRVMKTIFNGMVENNFLKRDLCIYYFSEAGYKQALKSSNILKYWIKYHTGVFWGIITAVVSSQILVYLIRCFQYLN